MKSVSAQKVYHNYLSEHKHMKSQYCQFSYNTFTYNVSNVITMVSTYTLCSKKVTPKFKSL